MHQCVKIEGLVNGMYAYLGEVLNLIYVAPNYTKRDIY